MKYIVTSGRAEHVGLAAPVEPGGEFDDKDIPEEGQEKFKRLVESGRVSKSSAKQKEGGE